MDTSNIVDVIDIVYLDSSQTSIGCKVRFGGSDDYVHMSVSSTKPPNSISDRVYKLIVRGDFGPIAPYSESTYTVERYKAIKLEEVALSFTREILANTDNAPGIELNSWPEQQKEAIPYKKAKDNNEPLPETPFIDNVLMGRNGLDGTETRDELVEKIMGKIAASRAMGYLIGKRHRLEKRILSATNSDDIRSIKWENEP